MTTPARLAGLLCSADDAEETARVRAIVRRGAELGVPAMAGKLARETAVTVELAFRLLAQAAGLLPDDERRH